VSDAKPAARSRGPPGGPGGQARGAVAHRHRAGARVQLVAAR
jgi:hypothetical protein